MYTEQYMRGRLAVLEATVAMLLRVSFDSDKDTIGSALSQMTTLNPEVQDPEFRRGLEEAVDQLRKRVAGTEFLEKSS